jgi:hypothetical protein
MVGNVCCTVYTYVSLNYITLSDQLEHDIATQQIFNKNQSGGDWKIPDTYIYWNPFIHHKPPSIQCL